ncbi:glutamate 5-kinase [Kineococcus radiotolerans]|uniref:Glutamate 5-kinase n=2 Tax=Kineococcus radiotolerans TaxID=131568 RepID=A6WDM8_KINRD|nr:glutamate 5-kinase [Kineococcus radiotolerans]ABS04917.1 glutamate 5-kinase [Kineococcus radiotolerans SRS30216 = ATCC BAA-149]MBB2901762.1 glutamate 5-kinase [Kineococcus radiotolerans]
MSTPSTVTRREDLARAGRVVVKVGSSSLTTAVGGLDAARLGALVDVLAARRAGGGEVVLVSSGAIAAGLAPLGLRKRPRDLASQQAAASVGQGLLLAEYARAFARAGLTVGQVLLTAEDVVRRTHYGNAQRTLERLLSLGVVPVVNENDTVATHEIRFGDNDRLAALVAHLVRADALVLLSDVDALYDAPPSTPGASRLATVRGPEDLGGVTVGSAGAAGVGTGGMATKVEAAGIAVAAGVPALVTSAALAGDALAGADVGTWFPVTATGRARRSTRQLWLAHAAAPAGRLVLDEGAVRAVRQARSSLLPAGVVGLSGRFRAGDPVDLVDGNGHALARGLVNYSSEELPDLLGRSTRELARQWGPAYEREVVHRDHLVLLGR